MSEKYKSQGTVRCYVGETDVHICFVPHSDYMVTHGGKHYTVFVTDGGVRHLKPCDKDEHGKLVGTKIDILEGNAIYKEVKDSDLMVSKILTLAGAQSAAMTNSKVEVEVKVGGEKLTLIGITIPAK